ncbi:MAG TPA: PfkB family carbohydrate kinase [Solirubrobacteraceae bacterium]|jgi:fructokinase|nr:PfkB family carbohydrate kinase [Solirubrobacteraceae bacterium]
MPAILCVGEMLVDFICERPVESVGDADVFVPHFGGAAANVAVLTARAGVPVALASTVGDDAWGQWLRERLVAEGVDVEHVGAAGQTAAAIVTLDGAGEASFQIYGETLFGGGALDQAVERAGALYFSSNTLVGSAERDATIAARDAALAAGRPVIFDPNLRLSRWRSSADAAASVNACVPGALLVRCNEAEATLMTGEYDPERAAVALLKAGARLVVITLGPRGAILRGEIRANAPGVAAAVRSTIGAGDAVTAVLLAKLALAGWYPAAAAVALRDAVTAGAEACERWGAVD